MLRLFILALLLLPAAPLQAAPAISCHCFQDRSFDPRRAAAADPYLLATTQNSLLAAAFNLAKKEVVRAKMSGSAGADLWIGHYLSARTGLGIDQWLVRRGSAPHWAGAVKGQNVAAAVLGPRVGKAVAQQLEDEAVARAVVEDLLVNRAGTDREVLDSLRRQRASLQETILAVFLEAQTRQSALAVFSAVQSKNKSWGELLDAHNIPPAEIEARVARMLR